MKLLPFALAVLGFALSSHSQSIPEGPGKMTVERMCKGCHGLENVVRARRTREKWTEIVDDMVARGAKGTDSEADEVIDYLSTHFGPDSVRKVNVNKAAAAEMTLTLEISAADADKIIQYRANHRVFKSIQDLMKVPGIDAKKIESNRTRVEF